jgi:hypothetical protein
VKDIDHCISGPKFEPGFSHAKTTDGNILSSVGKNLVQTYLQLKMTDLA